MTRGWKAAGAGIALAGLALVPAIAADGEQLFKAKCTTCHSAQKALDGGRKVAADKRQVHLEKFLANHHVPDAAQREAIVAYLLATVK